MAIKSILITNTEMVRAILGGSKTCIRQIIKGYIPQNAQFGYSAFTPNGAISCRGLFETVGRPGYGEKFFKLPYQLGDILYVRETVWQKTGHYLDVDGETTAVWCNEFRYAASDEKPEVGWNYSWAKRPSIHMPKEAVRIWLKVTAVRVEQLQDITSEQIGREGVEVEYPNVLNGEEKRYAFLTLWNSTINKSDLDRYGWDANPWVWVIEFERCEKPEIN